MASKGQEDSYDAQPELLGDYSRYLNTGWLGYSRLQTWLLMIYVENFRLRPWCQHAKFVKFFPNC